MDKNMTYIGLTDFVDEIKSPFLMAMLCMLIVHLEKTLTKIQPKLWQQKFCMTKMMKNMENYLIRDCDDG